MHCHLGLEAESARHDHRHVKQSIWQLHLHIYFRQCHYGLSLYRSCHAQLLAVTIRVIWLVVFSVEVVLPSLVQ
jgi:hypothetical protein